MIDPLAIALPAYLLMMSVEMIAGRIRRRQVYEIRDTAASLIMGAGAVLASTLCTTAMLLAALELAYHWHIASIPVGAAGLLAGLLLSDLAYYWSHRFSHECRWFWASHVVHHSSGHYNFSTALRSPWTDLISMGFLFWVPMAWIGFPPEQVLLSRAVVVVYQFWFHTELIGRLGVLEHILVTPRHHRVHHARNHEYLDRNYGAVLIIWDKMFGTFAEERPGEPVRYGLVKPIATFNPLRIALDEWIDLLAGLRRCRSLIAAFRFAFSRPGSEIADD